MMTLKDPFCWYETLNIDEKINLKAGCELLTGVSFADLGKLLPFRMRIALIIWKLYYILSQ